MGQSEKKQRERQCAVRWLQRRGITARLQDHEHPDFIVHHGAETLGIEIVEYHGGGASSRGGSGSRRAEATWAALQAYSNKYRAQHPDIDPYLVSLHFSRHKIPPPKSFEDFCTAVESLISQHGNRVPENAMLNISITADINPLLASYLIGVQLTRCRTHWEEWQWSALLSGFIGTSDVELCAVVARKLESYRPPAHLTSSHLVIVGGLTPTRTAAPLSTFHLGTYSRLNKALRDGPFDTVAILCLRDFIWSKAEGWGDLPAYE